MRQETLNYQCTVKAKDGEYVNKPVNDNTEKEPRSIYSAPEAEIIIGGAVNMVYTDHLLRNNKIGICRTNKWICHRIR